MKSDTAVIVAARDSYSDTWEAFFSIFFKYWPDCPYPVYLFAEEKVFPDPRVIPLLVKNDPAKPWGKQWADRIKKALSDMQADRFILLHTDYFLSQKIDTPRILGLEKLLRRDDIGYIRLCPVPPPKLPYVEDRTLGIIRKTDAYSISLQAAFWKRQTFEYFLIPGLNPGEYELAGSKNSYKMKELFLSAKKAYPALPYVHGISKDTWQYDAVRFLKSEGFGVEANRKKESLGSYLFRKSYLKRLKYGLKSMLKSS